MDELTADPHLLRTFLAVHRHRNLTRAAEELFVTQPAVSRRVARLEHVLGVVLIERLGKTIRPTEAGDALARDASTLIGSMERLAETVRSRQRGERGRLRIGASSTPGLYRLPDVLVRYRQRFPGVEVRYTVENSVRIEEKLVANDLDLGFVGVPLSHPGLRQRTVFEDEICFYAAQSHPLARRKIVSPSDLESDTCIVREPGSATRGLVDAWLRRSRVRLSPTIEMGCPEAAKVVVQSGFGFAYMSRFGLEGRRGGGLRPLRLRGADLRRPILLVLHADKHVTRPIQSFLDLAATMLDFLPAKRSAD